MTDLDSGAGLTRGKIALTHRGIDTLRPDQRAYRVGDLRCSGLAIRVAPSGLKTWDVAFRVRKSGVFRRLSLGAFPAVSLDAARMRTAELIRAAQSGRDLLAEEKAARVAADSKITVAELVETYLRRKVRGRLRTAGEIELRFKRALGSLKDRYIEEIHRRDLRQILDAVADRGAPREAQQQRHLMRVLFRWALSQDMIENDPAAGLASFGTSPRRDRVLSPLEIKAFWDWLETSNIPTGYVDALRFQLAVGARIGEAGGIDAQEIDQETWLWTLPADRSKNGRPRVTPLVGIARDIAERRLTECISGPLFTMERGEPLTSNCVASLLVKHRKKLPLAHFTSHDLRRTVATGLVDLGFSYEVVAAVLGHEVGAREVRTMLRHYVRSEMLEGKYKALEAWNARLLQILAGLPLAGNIVAMAGYMELGAA